MAKKKKHKRKKKYFTPDQIEYAGPIGMARYGKFMVMKNFMNAEQHKNFMHHAAERYPAICKDIDDRVNRICSLVREFHPVSLLKYGYKAFVAKSIGKTAEVELDSAVAIALRMIDYIQSIIVSTQKSEISIIEPTDKNKWKELYGEVKKLYYQLNTDFHVSHTALLKQDSKNYDEGYDEFYVKAQMLWTNVRGHRYSIHNVPLLRSLLLPHDDIFKELFNISIDEFLDGIRKIQDSLSYGWSDAYLDLKKFQKKTMNIVAARISEDTSLDALKEITHQVIAEQGWQEWQNSIMSRIFQFDLFDVKNVSGLPEHLLRELSWEPGEHQDFFATGEFAGWPLRLLPVQIRPFLYVEGRYYCFELFSLMDNLYRVVQRMITRLSHDYNETWNKKQQLVSERLPFELLEKLLPNSRTYHAIYYQWPTGKAGELNWCETDGLVLFDDHLIVVEIKAGAFTYTPPATDFPAYMDSIKNLLLKPAIQAKRFLDYLNSSEKVAIYDGNKNLIANLSRDSFRHITSCCVTIDNFTTLASQAENLKPVGTDLQGFPVWSVSVDDLQVYADIFDSPLIFTHFLEERKRAFESPVLRVNDELEHLSLYLKHNSYVTYAAGFYEDHPVTWHGYLSDLDKYFHALQVSPQTAKKPTQPLPKRIAEIISVLEMQRKPRRCKVASYLLDMDGKKRDTLDASIEDVLSRQTSKRKFIPFSMFGGTKLTIFCCMEGLSYPDLSWMYDYVFATLLRSKDEERIMLNLSFDNFNKIVNVAFDFLSLSNIPSKRFEKIKHISEEQRKNYLQAYLNQEGVKKIGRNEICPCGSGKKYKRCCGH